MISTTEKTKDDSPIRVFLERALADPGVVDDVGDAVFTNVGLGDRDPAALAEESARRLLAVDIANALDEPLPET
jgi:hypothetical protein